MHSASCWNESDLIISSIKAEISLKINASYILSALHSGWRDSKEQRRIRAGSAASDALDKKWWIFVCMDLVISWGSLRYPTPPTQHPPSSLQLQRFKQTLWSLCDNLFAPTGGNTWVNITRMPLRDPIFAFFTVIKQPWSSGRGQRAGSPS